MTGSPTAYALLDARLERQFFSDLSGWPDEDHAAAFATFLKSAQAETEQRAPLRPALPTPPSVQRLARMALDWKGSPRAFFEQNFEPFFVKPDQGSGFLTGYYEPEIPGSFEKSAAFPVPVLGRPADLVTFAQNEMPPAPLDPALSAARRTSAGLEPYFDRAAIEDGALEGKTLELLYLPDRVELFFAQVQGSARVRLPDGRIARLTYAGRNGHAYTTIARVIRDEGHMPLEAINLESLKSWLRANPEHAHRIMRLNRSYIFFSLSEALSEAEGPVGAASTTLDAGRSIAIDRRQWCYGLPFFITARLPDGDGREADFSRLMIAQDTGSAILGAARADLFIGSGSEAGRQAGRIRHRGDFTVLLPKE